MASSSASYGWRACCASTSEAVFTSANTGNVSTVISSTSALGGMMLHAVAMFLAVPTLSPVSIHILMPALRKSARTSGTPSCSLSSIAVAPCSTSSRSSSSVNSLIRLGSPSFSLRTSSADSLAAVHRTFHDSKSSISRFANTSVRRAMSAHTFSKLSNLRRDCSSEPRDPLASSSNITESAPLEYRRTGQSPSQTSTRAGGSRTTTDMRLRLDS
mmetsp:Transcript_2769/g.6437  ORF Transcript_2769/g.6437 Transcript_2769/m.6437 type:complete len:215 (+) Transcript_2769:1851-2495(+)